MHLGITQREETLSPKTRQETNRNVGSRSQTDRTRNRYPSLPNPPSMRSRTLPRISLLLPRSFDLSSSSSSRRLANVNRRPTWMPPAPGTCRCRIHGRGTAAAASRAQQLRQQPPKPLNCSSNERPPPASDIIPTAGAKLGPPPPPTPPPPPQSVRNWSQPTTQGQTPDGHEHKHDKTGDAEADTNPPRAKPPRDTRPSQTYGTTLTRRPQKTSCQPIGAVNGQPRPTIAYLARQNPRGDRDNGAMAETRDSKRLRRAADPAADPAEHLPTGITETQEELKEHWFVGSIDQGTTSTRFLIFNGLGDPIAIHQIEIDNHYPHSGSHEHDPLELLSSVEECIEKATAKFVAQGHAVSAIRGIGITNQRETTVLWDTRTGEPLHNAIVWSDTRTTPIVREFRARPGADRLQGLCGLPLSTYPSSVKLRWLLDNVPAVREAYDAGHLAFGTVDSWLIYRLNGGAALGDKAVHITDSTNASRTMFMNLRTLRYDDELLSFFGIDRSKIRLPKIAPSSDPTAFGTLAGGVLKGVPIAGCISDQSAALVGQCGFSPGQAKNTYGTGCFLLYNVGDEPVFSKSGLLATVAYDFGKGRKPAYALEGSVAVAGSGVKFLINNLSFADDASRISELAETVPDNGGVVFVTAFSGLFAPYWIDDAKGTLFGITAHTQKGHIARATLEATCYQTKAILDAMAKDSGHALESLAVDGGLSNSDLCMQTQADVSGIRVDRPGMRETTALGAAISAGLALGVWDELGDLEHVNQSGRKIFTPSLAKEKADKMFKKWEQAVEMSRGWASNDLE